MTKALAASYRTLLLTTGINLSSVNLKICAMSSSYVYSAAHNFLDDVSNIITTSGNLASKTTTDGYLDFADISVGSPAGGSTITQFWLYRDTGTAATSDLIYYWNEDAAAGAISISTNGEAVTVVVPTGGLFRV